MGWMLSTILHGAAAGFPVLLTSSLQTRGSSEQSSSAELIRGQERLIYDE